MNRQQLDLGSAVVSPETPLIAGRHATVRLDYTVGHPVDDTGFVNIVFRYSGDFGVPQFTDPAAENYCSVATTGDCRLEPRWDPKGNVRPWGRCLELKVMGGYLDRGDLVSVVFGDPAGGSPGWRVQTFCQDRFEFRVLVDPIATRQFKEVPNPPGLRVVPDEPVRAIAVAPSQAMLGARFTARLRLEDRWGNVVGEPTAHVVGPFDEADVVTLELRDPEADLGAVTNPIEIVAERSRYARFWGDLHGQTEETIGTNDIDAYYTFARDRACLDVAAHQGNDFQISDALWERLQQAAEDYDEAGRFVTFPGYEWSGNTPLGGDRNVYYDGPGGPLVHSCTDLLPDQATKYPIAATATELFAALGEIDRPRPFVFAHVGGRYANLDQHLDGIEVAVEVHSAWGSFDWLLTDALERGHRVAVVANSDEHKGRPGASYPGDGHFGSLGGLTCILAPTLDRAAVAAALRARRCYATTGHRPLFAVTVVLPDGTAVPIGGEATLAEPGGQLHLRVVGTAPLAGIDIRDGTQVSRQMRPPGSLDSNRLLLLWGGAERRGRDRHVCWDGILAVDGNQVARATPVNFHNPDRQPWFEADGTLAWQSITTGGIAGLIVELDQPGTGAITVETAQGTLNAGVSTLSAVDATLDAGGLDKQLLARLLPLNPPSPAWHGEVSLDKILHPGVNPIHVRVVQEDGHLLWSSPIYLTLPPGK